MQLTLYYNEDDKWLIKKIKDKAYAERRSPSAIVLDIVAEHFGETRQYRPWARRRGRKSKSEQKERSRRRKRQSRGK
jgi:hypothetical protein